MEVSKCIGSTLSTYCILGIVDKILSWGPFQPLAKLSYVAYLIHFTVYIVLASYVRHSQLYSHFYMAFMIIVCLSIILVLSFALCLLLEVPILTCERLLLSPRKAKQ